MTFKKILSIPFVFIGWIIGFFIVIFMLIIGKNLKEIRNFGEKIKK